MKWLIACVGLVLVGCSWSNSLYHARRLSNAAATAEREDRGFEAGNLWGQVVTKADSAFARDPNGASGAEALWLRGRALARMRNCADAAVSLEQAWVAYPEAAWREELLFTLADCREELRDPQYLQALLPLTESTDSTVRRTARERAGRALVGTGAYEAALTMLEGIPGHGARIERSIALSELGRTDDALAQIEPLLAAADTTVAWERLLGNLADRDVPDADALLERLLRTSAIADRRAGGWHLAMARGAAMPPAAQRRHLEAAARVATGTLATDARVGLAELQLAATATPAEVDSVAAGWEALTAGQATTALVLARYQRLVAALVADTDSVTPGAPLGDLTLFHHAEIARDSLGAPRLARHLFARLESGWPDSPYLPKALFARVHLEPDSAAALRERLAGYPTSPYLAFVRGEAGVGFRVLEDSLARFIATRAAAAVAQPSEDPNMSVFE